MGNVWDNRISLVRMKSYNKRKNTMWWEQLSNFYQHWEAKAWGANRIRYPGSPCLDRWMLNIKNFLVLKLTRETFRLRSTVARLELKRIGGDPYKWWNMWFNAIIRAKPYQFLTIFLKNVWKIQVLHGCRQLVFWDVGLISLTSETPWICCSLFSIFILFLFLFLFIKKETKVIKTIEKRAL